MDTSIIIIIVLSVLTINAVALSAMLIGYLRVANENKELRARTVSSSSSSSFDRRSVPSMDDLIRQLLHEEPTVDVDRDLPSTVRDRVSAYADTIVE